MIKTVTGCYTPYMSSWMSVYLIFMWPPFFTLAVLYYCGEYILPAEGSAIYGVLRTSNLPHSQISSRICFSHQLLQLKLDEESFHPFVPHVGYLDSDSYPLASIQSIRLHYHNRNDIHMEGSAWTTLGRHPLHSISWCHYSRSLDADWGGLPYILLLWDWP